MIWDFLVGSVTHSVIQALASVLPNGSVSVQSFTGLVHYYAWLDGWLPVTETLEVAVTAFGIYIAVIVYYIALWAIRKVPFIGVS